MRVGTSRAISVGMDRELSSRQRRRPWLIAARRMLIGVFAIVTVAWAGQRMLTPTIALSDVRVAAVERGPLRASVSSTGVIVPRTEQTVSSPASAEIRSVHVSPGEAVTKGQLMLELDTTASALSLSNLDEQLALRREATLDALARLPRPAVLAALQRVEQLRQIRSLLSRGSHRAQTLQIAPAPDKRPSIVDREHEGGRPRTSFQSTGESGRFPDETLDLSGETVRK